jgi:hypothetical protein
MALQTPQEPCIHAKGYEHGPAESEINQVVHREPLVRGPAI